MKIKRLLSLIAMFALTLTLMACPSIENSPPELVQIIDGEIFAINEIIYEHTYREDFDPDAMVQSLIDNQNLVAIDYDQSGLIIGQDREYFVISDQIKVVSFYDLWLEGDANYDGVVDEADEELYGTTKTDEDGVPVYDSDKILIVEFFPAGSEINFTLRVEDEEGDFTTLSGVILIVE